MRQNNQVGIKVFVDQVVLKQVDEIKPVCMSRTAWVNYLLQQALASMNQSTNG